MTTCIRIATVLSAAIFLVLVGSATSTVADEIELDREVSLSGEPDNFHVVSDSVGFKVNDRFELIFDEGTLDLWYTADASSSSPPSWELEVEFEQVFSMADNGNGLFDDGDTILKAVSLEDVSFALSYSTLPLPEGGNKTTVIAESDDGSLTLTFTITTAPTIVGDVPISPGEVKLDIVIAGFDLEGEASHVCLGMAVESDLESAVEYEDLDDSAELNLTQADMGGFLRWSDTALVDGVERPVTASWDDETLTLAYPAGEQIAHDPIVGIRGVAPLSGPAEIAKTVGNALLYGVGLVLAVAAVLGAVAVRSRKSH